MQNKDILWYTFCFLIGVVLYFFIPKDYQAPQTYIGTQIIPVEAADTAGNHCFMYQSPEGTKEQCSK